MIMVAALRHCCCYCWHGLLAIPDDDQSANDGAKLSSILYSGGFFFFRAGPIKMIVLWEYYFAEWPRQLPFTESRKKESKFCIWLYWEWTTDWIRGSVVLFMTIVWVEWYKTTNHFEDELQFWYATTLDCSDRLMIPPSVLIALHFRSMAFFGLGITQSENMRIIYVSIWSTDDNVIDCMQTVHRSQ